MSLSIVIPVHNEAGNVLGLLREVVKAMADVSAYEVIVVDDASNDETPLLLAQARREILPALRVLRHEQQCGQSTALYSGVRAATYPWIATLDGDGQNDPADIPRLLARARDAGVHRLTLVIGHRVQRHDTRLRRLSSRLANRVRAWWLSDATPDTGCGLKLFPRDAFLELPYFDHMHRFMPALIQRSGGTVVSVPVNHRPRHSGRSHYGIGNRLWVGIVDLFGVRWLQRRNRRPVRVVESKDAV